MPLKAKPIFADEETAAALFCLGILDFRALVEGGHFPPPRDLGGFLRWHVDSLEKIAKGDAMDGGFEW
jgi:hypothetical protein